MCVFSSLFLTYYTASHIGYCYGDTPWRPSLTLVTSRWLHCKHSALLTPHKQDLVQAWVLEGSNWCPVLLKPRGVGTTSCMLGAPIPSEEKGEARPCPLAVLCHSGLNTCTSLLREASFVELGTQLQVYPPLSPLKYPKQEFILAVKEVCPTLTYMYLLLCSFLNYKSNRCL